MAEAVAVIGLVASIASLVDLSVKVVSRVRDYNECVADVPKTFRSLADRLPLLTQTLTRVQSRAQAGYIAVDVAKELNTLVDSVREQVKVIEQCLESILPTPGVSRFDRVLIGLKGVAKDEKVKQAVEKIHHGIDVLVLHQTTSAVEVGDHILQGLSRLSLQNSPSQQSVLNAAVQQMFGLCLGQAPLIEPDAIMGRQGEIQQLHQWLSSPPNAQGQRVVSIVGMGGLGKTQLSLAYARQYGHQYSSVFWLNAKDKKSLRQSMSALTTILFPDIIAVAANADEESVQVGKVRHWLSEASNDRWLIIFDNYDDPSLPNIASSTGFDIRQFFPIRVQGSILITTRSSKLAFSKPLKLQKLQDVDTCVAVLSHRSGRELTQDPDARRLAVRLDGLPLALAVAGTYLAQTDTSCSEYLDLYGTAWNDLHGPGAEELMEYEDRTLSSTWTISLDRVRDHDADVGELLRFFGYFNNEDIWYELVKGGAQRGPSWMGRVTVNKICFDRAMSKLGSYSLVEARGGSYRVHPCLHDWIFEHLNTPLSESLFITAIDCLTKNVPDWLDPQYWTVSRRLINHLYRLQHQRFAVLWDGNASNIDILDACQSFGIMYAELCEFDGAENMFIRALAGKEKTLGLEHSSTLTAVSSLGVLYSHQGKPDEAEQMFLRALAGKEKTLGLEHKSTVSVIHNLGVFYDGQGKLDEAEQMYLRALAWDEKARGLEHTSTLDTVVNLGILYCHQGKLDEAEQMFLRALAGMEKTLGPKHTSTITASYSLGILYHKQGKIDEAEHIFSQALAGRETALGSEHMSTLETVHNLGLLYHREGRLDEAEQMYLRALPGREKVFGLEHALTLDVVNDLGVLYRDQGMLNKAKAMFQRLFIGRTRVLGPDHPDTQKAACALET